MPIVDLDGGDDAAASAIDAGCRQFGFFALAGHGVADELRCSLIAAAAEFFSLPDSCKSHVSLAHGGTAWRGWFPLGGELTSGVPDLKEGYYFGRECPLGNRPLEGQNIWPMEPQALRTTVTAWMSSMATLGQRVLSLMAVGLGLDAEFFARQLTAEPTELFRIFRYPPHPLSPDGTDRWGVAEHSDYGLLTLLAHDGSGGLEVNVAGDWIEAPSDPSLIICNLGDMLDRLTAGRYRSTPHRVRNTTSHDRYSLPYFLDPGWDAVVDPLPIPDGLSTTAETDSRWDGTDLQQISGTYGEWLWKKVSKVFPDFASTVKR